MKSGAMVLCSFTSAAKLWRKRSGRPGQGGIKLLDFSLSSIGWRRGLGRGGAFLLVSPLLGPLPTRSSRGEDGELDAALPASQTPTAGRCRPRRNGSETALVASPAHHGLDEASHFPPVSPRHEPFHCVALCAGGRLRPTLKS